jgi:hypothetical protein
MSNQVTLTSTGVLTFEQGNQAPTIRRGNPGDALVLDAAGQPAWSTETADANPMTTINDMIVGGTAGAPARIAVGAPGTVLTVGGDNVPAWAADTDTSITALQAAHFVADNAALADGSLASGDFSLWLDQTNGAAKLMVKAKQADGTVKTATIVLA